LLRLMTAIFFYDRIEPFSWNQIVFFGSAKVTKLRNSFRPRFLRRLAVSSIGKKVPDARLVIVTFLNYYVYVYAFIEFERVSFDQYILQSLSLSPSFPCFDEGFRLGSLTTYFCSCTFLCFTNFSSSFLASNSI